ncbi:S9 family peptidase [Fibrella aquatica]|uniref:S9 family peptidase n=1 Tax=Fibrella aquatica TaxID=3242487 RepID=UPI00351FD7AA
MSRIATFLVCFFISSSILAQSSKRALTADDYDRWESVRTEKISKDGRWISYQIDPQAGDGRLELTDATRKAPVRSFPRGYMAQFSPDNRFLVMRLKAPVADVRKAKLKKKKADEMPKDSLLVYNLATGQTTKLPNIKSFMVGKESGTWLAVLQEANAPKPAAENRTTSRRDTLAPTKPVSTTTGTARRGVTKRPKGDDLVLMNLADGKRRTVTFVSNVAMSDNGQTILYSRESARDSLKAGEPFIPGVFTFNTANGQTMLIDSSAKNRLYKGLAVDKTGNQLAWMASADSAGSEVRVFTLRYKNLAPAPVTKGKRSKTTTVDAPYRVLVDTVSSALPSKWTMNEYREPRFSEDGTRLYFSTSPTALKVTKDTLTPDDEKVKMDVWSWTDGRLQPMQQKRLKEEKERGFLTVADLSPAGNTFGRVTLLASREIPNVSFDPKVNARYLLGMSDLPYQVQSSWDPGHTDMYLIDTQTGEKKRIANDVMVSQPRLSPTGRYAYWFDERDSLWRAWSIADGRRIDLTRGLGSKFFDEEHDTPDLPGAYGSAGWTADDRYLWVYDRYDIWQIDPTGREKPTNLTNAWGRTNKVRLRRADLDPDEKAIDTKQDLWLTGIWESNKNTGILKATPPAKGAVSISPLANSAHRYFGLGKAKDASTMTFYRGNFQEPINIFLTDTTFATPTQLTKTNPQQDSIRWGSVELVKWVGTNGVPLEGLLYKPEGYDQKTGVAQKKYPMLTYFYERNVETLNDYRAPSPSRSTINIPFCVSNGYMVFVPDIVYTTGQPGPNAYDCIVPGVLSLLNRDYIDRDRLGIQGQSWGGYQTAYIITRTNLFRAAMAGAAVANMTSAYGGIRWETGVVRQFQYEKTQSRIGGTLWDKPMNYLENSPLFFANRVETPLMLMHNDADGAVPWQQGIELFTGLRRLGKPVWMVVYNGEGHNLTARHNAKDLSIRMYQFFDHYLKDAPVPVWMKDGRTAVEKDRGEMKYETDKN